MPVNQFNTTTSDGGGTVSGVSNPMTEDLDGGGFDIDNASRIVGEDGTISGKTVEAGQTLILSADESMVVSDDYTAEGTLTVNGSFGVI